MGRGKNQVGGEGFSRLTQQQNELRAEGPLLNLFIYLFPTGLHFKYTRTLLLVCVVMFHVGSVIIIIIIIHIYFT